ncbi:MAG: hypothetical protein ACFB0B_22570 [Thermonemataceae bacterium]
MKLIDYLLLSVTVGLLIIGIYEIFIGNFQRNYWLFMLMLIALFTYGYRRQKRVEAAAIQQKKSTPPKNKPKRKKKKRK